MSRWPVSGRCHPRLAVAAALAGVALTAPGLACHPAGPVAPAAQSPSGAAAPGMIRAAPGTAVSYPAGAGSAWYTGRAIDAPCTGPSLGQLRAWLASPYRAVGVSVSGASRTCPEPSLSAAWVAGVSALGWRILPLDQGLQAPCSPASGVVKMSWRPDTARAQGRSEAGTAAARAGGLGIAPGSGIYADMESYPAGRSCQRAVLSYLSGWTQGLHARGYLSGVYSGNASGTAHLSAAYFAAGYARPDAVWNAWYTRSPALTGWPGVPDSYWPAHQRIRQYTIHALETYGGVTLRIDNDNADAPVATVAHRRTVTSSGPVTARRAPGASAPPAGRYRPGTAVSVICRAGGWDKLASGSYLSSRYLPAPAADQRPVAACRYPYQVIAPAGAALHARPAASAARTGRLGGGALAWVTCQQAGSAVGRTRVWDRLGSRSWISDYYVATPGTSSFTPPIPRC